MNIKLELGNLETIRTVDSRLMSYNVEMTEVTGGTFWKEFTPAQIAGTAEFPGVKDFSEMAGLIQWYDPIDLYNPRLRKLAKELGSAWIRVSGSWATKTYYDFDGHTGGKAPEGFQSVLTKDQWVGVLEFAKAVDGKILVSVGNCEGNHPGGGPLDLSQAKLLFKFSSDYGVPISAAEFMNEPNILEMSGAPKGYTPVDYVRDHDLFNAWVRENYPDCLIVGPCTADSQLMEKGDGNTKSGAGLAEVLPSCSTEDLMRGSQVALDVFSYHCYNGVSERIASVMPDAHWDASQALSDDYLAMAGNCARSFVPVRDKYVPGGQIWVTESADAGGGGNTWGSTYLDVPRTLNELGEFATITDGVIFHNTLASSDYGFLRHSTFEPRPNYFAVLLWQQLMGNTVYDSKIPTAEGAHVFCHSRKDGKDGCVYMIINNSETETTIVELPQEAVCYKLAGKDGLRSSVMTLNGRDLVLGENNELPALSGETVSGKIELASGTCTFVIM